MTSLKIDTDAVADLPPSAKLVYLVLQEADGALTQSEVCDRTLLPRRTVRTALGRLDDEDLVEEDAFLGDARKRLYDVS